MFPYNMLPSGTGNLVYANLVYTRTVHAVFEGMQNKEMNAFFTVLCAVEYFCQDFHQGKLLREIADLLGF